MPFVPANQRKATLKSKTIFILRHGETDFNKNGMVQGRGVNASINEAGKEQARKAGATLSDISFDHVFTSALIRTKETVGQFIHNGTPVTSLDGFDEISWGNQEGKEASYDAKNLYADTVNGWRRGELHLNVGGGENPLEVMDRQQSAMQQVLETDGENILICMHGRAMRVLLSWTLNYPLNFMDGFPHANCSYYVLGYRGSSFYLKDFNRVGHLG
ncbi:histidine phosphatase family protein [Ekhidna sp.]|uniref:histidine phosphatase family protein n=1 Tax=Ekhidna sp. TaxID=2608089 RepID=UPI0032EAA822